ncbi:hypothetical protein OQJ13_13410 [Legionella sp. PATHC035]|uniref:hypothetical protein n=1 Tax=Legionella sp. PATHC035 TaxID=2992040 RepID=UPI0022432C1B|nr:hypothetical protein [Legionella sp. PATHC035]MCW8409972.1 hypothetical protein [Legionella sp. PATHC035]
MDISFLFGFLTGCFTTALGGLKVQKFINNRKNMATIKNKKILDLNRLFDEFPQFMSAIKNDIKNPSHQNIREFFVVDKDAILNSSVPRFRYELSTEILPALNRLEELGYIEKLKNNCLHYRIEEEFVMQLQALAIATKD